MFEIVLTYNNEDKHSATGMSPQQARMNKNEVRGKNKYSPSRQYLKENIRSFEVGDNVKIYRKKDKLDKERVSVWLPTVYTIKIILKTSLGQKHFYLEGQSKAYFRHEMLKV